jgi:hypothetical protein
MAGATSSPASADPTALVVQAIASFGTTDASVNGGDTLADAAHSQPSQVAVPADSFLARSGGT